MSSRSFSDSCSGCGARSFSNGVCDYCRNQAPVGYRSDKKSKRAVSVEAIQDKLDAWHTESGDGGTDALYEEAVAIVLGDRRASISYVQRKLRIGYNRAARLLEMMEAAGLVSPLQSSGNREILVPPLSTATSGTPDGRDATTTPSKEAPAAAVPVVTPPKSRNTVVPRVVALLVVMAAGYALFPKRPQATGDIALSIPERASSIPTPAPAADVAAPEARTLNGYVIQIAAYIDADKARALRDALAANGVPAYTESVTTSQGLRTRVRAGPFASHDEADRVRAQLKEMKVDGSVVPL